MSEFSEKLSYYITQSGYNVYQLAKEAALDRTTLQKTVKGQRLPSVDYIKGICSNIKISKKQEEDNRYYLLPHYIVTHRHVLLCPEESSRALLVVNRETTQGYRGELEILKKEQTNQFYAYI